MGLIVEGLDLPNDGKTCVSFRLRDTAASGSTSSADVASVTLQVLDFIRNVIRTEGIEVSEPELGKLGQGAMRCPISTGSVNIVAFGAVFGREHWQIRTLFSQQKQHENAKISEIEARHWERIRLLVSSALKMKVLETGAPDEIEWISWETAERQSAS